MSRLKYTGILLVGAILLSCSNDDFVATTADNEIQAWLDTTGTVATRDDATGIYYYADSVNASGTQASPGGIAAIYYTLSDLDGNVIASHQRTNGDSLLFKVGASAVYPLGADFGVSLMRVGEIYNFILPPSQGYAELTSGAIDQDLIALLQIQLVAVHNEADLFAQEIVDIQQYIDDNLLDSLNLNPTDFTVFFPNNIAYKRRSIGTGNVPVAGDTVEVDYSGRFIDDTNFDTSEGFRWIFGSNEPRELLSGFEFGVSQMQTGERALFLVPSNEGYRESALVIPDFIDSDLVEDAIIPDYVTRVPPYQTLLFEITRVD
ncbi:FKBP-type peptidyl-prolyl cis-trans isomerase [Ekhidna sp.]|uniref:FKBP-type peptidyl-prolyl cis-trans isomerase n=1 Tax=Ekhidna sp. TaxID=2608089 RepID=UPI003BAA0062